MLTGMAEDYWVTVLRLFIASCSRRSFKGRHGCRFLEALHYFTVHNTIWRALPAPSPLELHLEPVLVGMIEAIFEALAALRDRSPNADIRRHLRAGLRRGRWRT